jgi:hypothetical protein
LIVQSDDAVLRAAMLSDSLRDAEAFAATFPSKLLHFVANLTTRPDTRMPGRASNSGQSTRRIRSGKLAMSTDKRKAKRRQVGTRAWVDFGPGARVQTCFVKDMSDTGARLALVTPGLAPREFVLQFAPDGSVGRRCQVRWQRGKELGVQFIARLLKGRRADVGILEC